MNISLDNDSTSYRKDQILFKEGEKAEKIYIIKSGAILCLKRSKERLVPIFLAKEKMILGEEAVMTQKPHSYTAIAIKDSDISAIEAKTVGAVMKVAPPWIGGLLRTLSERVADTSEVISEHRISHPALFDGNELSAQEENRLKKLIG
jgi:CRP/FNR family transcriptional regulator